MTHKAPEAQRQCGKGDSPTPPDEGVPEAEPAIIGERLLTVEMVGERLALSARQVWRLCDSGKFPRPLSIGPRCKRWRVSDVERFLRDLHPDGTG